MIAVAPSGRVVSQREVARRLGVSHTTIQKAKHSRRITPEPDGTWDVEKVRAQLARTAHPARKTAAIAIKPPSASRQAARSATKPTPIGAPAPALDPPPSGASYHNARTANEVLKAQERKLRLEERKGQLVDKARALLLVHRLAKEERDAILGWPARVAAEMAAELGVDAHRLQMMLDARLRELLAERNDVRIAVT
jgi:transcriptional regulator with XRE-family HTH domain